MLSVRRRCWIAIASWAVAAWFAAVFPVDAAGPAAQSAQTEFATRARQAMLMDADSGAVLFQHKADERMSPASMSKLMGLALAFKALKAGEERLDDEILMSVNAWRKGGAPSGTSAMMVPVNTREKLENLLQGMSSSRATMPASRSPRRWRQRGGFARLMTEEGAPDRHEDFDVHECDGLFPIRSSDDGTRLGDIRSPHHPRVSRSLSALRAARVRLPQAKVFPTEIHCWRRGSASMA